MTQYTSIKIPRNLSLMVQAVIEKNGYRSVSEFVLEATRVRLREVMKYE